MELQTLRVERVRGKQEMKIYSIGPDDLDDYELSRLDTEVYEWIVYHYLAFYF